MFFKKKKSTRKRKKPSKIWRFVVFVKNVIMIPIVAYTLFVGGVGSWFYYSGNYDAAVNKIIEVKNDVTLRAGLSLKDILLEGQEYTPKEDILDSITNSAQLGGAVNMGEPLLNIDLWKIKNRLERLTWVHHASVERLYPSTLSVSITERNPIGLWQDNGKIGLVDDEGQVINVKDIKDFSDLVIIIGDDAPSSAAYLLNMMQDEPEIADKVSSIIRISKRRWNVRLRNDIEVKLPEIQPEKAWAYLAQMNDETSLLDSDIKSVDLRIEGKMFVK